MSKLKVDNHIKIEIDEEDLKLIDVKQAATYEKIKDYVLKQSCLKVSTLYITQVKCKLGIIER